MIYFSFHPTISVDDLQLQQSEVNVSVCVVYHVNCGFNKPPLCSSRFLVVKAVSELVNMDGRV